MFYGCKNGNNFINKAYNGAEMYKVKDSLIEQKISREKSNNSFLLFSAILLLLAIVFSTVFGNTFFSVMVSGNSMKPTLSNGDVLLVNKLKEPKRGDIVVIKGETMDGSWIIKRVIAIEGDTVEIKDGYVFINGERLNENYTTQDPTLEIDWQEPKVIAKGEYFYLGDNRGEGESSDSRVEQKATCQREQILGVVGKTSLLLRPINKFLYKIFSGVGKVST